MKSTCINLLLVHVNQKKTHLERGGLKSHFQSLISFLSLINKQVD